MAEYNVNKYSYGNNTYLLEDNRLSDTITDHLVDNDYYMVIDRDYVTAGRVLGAPFGIDATAEGVGNIVLGDKGHAEGHGESYTTVLLTGAANATTYIATLYSPKSGSVNLNRSADEPSTYKSLEYIFYYHLETVFYAITNTGSIAQVTAVGNLSNDSFTITFDKTLNSQTALSNTQTDLYIPNLIGKSAHKEGHGSLAAGFASHAEGINTSAFDTGAHSEGYETIASGEYSHAEGLNTLAEGYYSHSEGANTQAGSGYAHAEGYYTQAQGEVSHAEGNGTIASGNDTHAEGCYTIAAGPASHAEGYGYAYCEVALSGSANSSTYVVTNVIEIAAKSQSNDSFTKGAINNGPTLVKHDFDYIYGIIDKLDLCYIYYSSNYHPITSAYLSGVDIIIELDQTLSTNNEAFNNVEAHLIVPKALDYGAHGEGVCTVAYGEGSHAEGIGTIAYGDGSHAEGNHTIAESDYSHVFGVYNSLYAISSAGSAKLSNDPSLPSFVEIVGNGTAAHRSNARTLDWNGNEVLAGTLTVGTHPTNNMDVATKEYVDNLTPITIVDSTSGSTVITNLSELVINKLTKSQYDAISTPNSTQLYMITDDTIYATQNYVDTAISNIDALPSQSGNSGKFLTTNGTSASWATVTITDNKVSQSASTTSDWRKLLMHYDVANTSTAAVTSATNVVYGAVGISAQPSTGTIRATAYNVADNVTMSYNSTTHSLDITVL